MEHSSFWGGIIPIHSADFDPGFQGEKNGFNRFRFRRGGSIFNSIDILRKHG
jgi:hypothetical protein